MIDLIHAGFHALERVERLWHVAGDGHTHAMGFAGDGFDHFGRKEGVQLDLLESGGMITLHHCAAFLGRLGGYVAEGFQTARIHQTRQQQTRTEGRTLLDGIALRDEVVEFAAAIARRGDARG